MAKRRENFCAGCGLTTMHVYKRVAFRKSKREGYGMRELPPKCLRCMMRPGEKRAAKKERTVHISHR
jgi:hypothetical protein